MKKYKVLVRGENFLMNLDGDEKKLGFYTIRFVGARDEEGAKEKAIAMLRDDKNLRSSVLNDGSDAPMLFAEEITEVESFDSLGISAATVEIDSRLPHFSGQP